MLANNWSETKKQMKVNADLEKKSSIRLGSAAVL